MRGKIQAINITRSKDGVRQSVTSAKLIENYGIEGDLHAADNIKQLTLLSCESGASHAECPEVKKINPAGNTDFGENITTLGIKLSALNTGDKLLLGSEAVIEITRIGKECLTYCEIQHKQGDCPEMQEGAFARVAKSGQINTGDEIKKIAAAQEINSGKHGQENTQNIP